MKYLKSFEIFESKKENKFSGKNRIILLGPPNVGKTTISEELGKELGLEVLSLDLLNGKVIKDYSEKGRIKTVEVAVSDKKYQDCILDFGGGHVYFGNSKDLIKDYKNVFVLIPNEDFELSQELLKKAHETTIDAIMRKPIEHILKSLESPDCEFDERKKKRLIRIVKKIISGGAGKLEKDEIPKASLKEFKNDLELGFKSSQEWNKYYNYYTKKNDKINRSLTDNIIEVFTEKGNRRSKSAIVNEIIKKLK